MDLADSRLGQIEDDADFRHRQVFIVIKDHDQAFFPAQALRNQIGEHRFGQPV